MNSEEKFKNKNRKILSKKSKKDEKEEEIKAKVVETLKK